MPPIKKTWLLQSLSRSKRWPVSLYDSVQRTTRRSHPNAGFGMVSRSATFIRPPRNTSSMLGPCVRWARRTAASATGIATPTRRSSPSLRSRARNTAINSWVPYLSWTPYSPRALYSPAMLSSRLIGDAPFDPARASLRGRGAFGALGRRAAGVDARHVAHRETPGEDEAVDQQSRRDQKSRHQPAEVAADHHGNHAEEDIDAEQTAPEKRHD